MAGLIAEMFRNPVQFDKSRQKGFSLIELMLVVAIIGLLASIATQSFMRMKTNAIRAETKSSLAGIFTTQKTFFAEHNSYSLCLTRIGFDLPGKRRYAVGFNTDSSNCGAGGTGSCLSYDFSDPAATCDLGTDTMFPATENGPTSAATPSTATRSSFLAASCGWPEQHYDEWTIDQNKNLVNVSYTPF